MIRLFVIDDHYLIVEGLYSSFDLKSDEFVVTGYGLSVDEALAKIDPEQTDIILLDLFIREADPVVNVKRIREACPAIPVVILSNEHSTSWQVEMFRHGIRAYLYKGEEIEQMRQVLQRVHAGKFILPEEVAGLMLPSDQQRQDPYLLADIRDILEALSHGRTVKEIASKMLLSESAIEKKLQAARRAYDAKTNIELVYKAMVNRSGI